MENLNYSSIGRRFGALLIDGFILGILGLIAGNLIPIVGGVLAWFFYGPVLESSEIRATIGKHLMGIQVVDFMGRRISLRAALIRNFMKIFSAAIFCLGFVIAFFTQRRQALHDLLADTVVVYGRNETPVVDAWLDNSKEILRAGKSKINSASPEPNESVASQLERLNALRDKGALTEEEFEAAKRRILS